MGKYGNGGFLRNGKLVNRVRVKVCGVLEKRVEATFEFKEFGKVSFRSG